MITCLQWMIWILIKMFLTQRAKGEIIEEVANIMVQQQKKHNENTNDQFKLLLDAFDKKLEAIADTKITEVIMKRWGELEAKIMESEGVNVECGKTENG